MHEHARFLRSYDDVVGLRRAVQDAWERAALPTTSEAEARRLLHFVLCGGGPTGSELAAERRIKPEDDLLTALVEAEIDGRSFTWTYDPAKAGEYAAKLGP